MIYFSKHTHTAGTEHPLHPSPSRDKGFLGEQPHFPNRNALCTACIL